ncbi:SdrD B-like domain-containing protein [Actinotalea sp.]|uniref:SdrD B-like domain-containing protein n=1 Tax=Actinotalea sp. TaxID=1872145 RepID=UPI0035674F5C
MLGSVPTLRGAVAPRSLRARFSRAITLLTAFAVAMLGVVVVAPTAQADGALQFTASLASPSTALQGGTFSATFTAQNPAGSSTPAYNAGYRLVLPAGISVAPGVDPAWSSSTTDPGTGVTTVIWSNLSDLLAGSGGTAGPEVSFTVPLRAASTVALGPATISGGVYVDTDARTLPTFDAAGNGTGSTTAYELVSTTTTLVPFTLTKSLIGWAENELLRGVHENRARFDLRIDNNEVKSSTNFSIVDYIPAELEFLGCGAVGVDGNPDVNGDNSPAGFLEAGTTARLNAADFGLAAGTCPLPTSVETVTITTDPDGTGPVTVGKVYTVVTWDNTALRTAAATALAGDGALGAGESARISYVVGIPQNPNVEFPAGTSTAGVQASNLSNNPVTATTREATPASTAETSVTNAAMLTGTYDDPNGSTGAQTYTDEGQETLTLEDVALVKTASTGEIVQGGDTLWTLTTRVSEYTTSSTGIVLTDILPDGLEPQVTGTDPAWVSRTDNADGTVTLTWNIPPLANGAVESHVVTLATEALASYRVPASPSEPVRAQDSWTNTATLTSTTTDLDGTVRTVDDASSAGQTAAPIELFKQVASPDYSAGPGITPAAACTAATWPGLDTPQDPAAFTFTPGDVVCWRLTVRAPAGLDTTNEVLTDFLPAGFSYVTDAVTGRSAVATGDAVIASETRAGATGTWTFTNAGDLEASQLAQIVIPTRITDVDAAADGDLLGNLAKLRYSNTDGTKFQLRTQTDVTWIEPVLALAKTASPTSGVRSDDPTPVAYTVTVTNTGHAAAEDLAFTDTLPAQVDCTAVSGLTVNGTTSSDLACTDHAGSASELSGTLEKVELGTPVTVTYSVQPPATLAPGEVLRNTARITSFVVVTNDPANPTTPYTPNLTATRDVTVVGAGVTKTADKATATVGEWITYTVRATLPHGTTLYGARLTDAVPAGLAVDTTTTPPTATVNGSSTAVTTTLSGTPAGTGVTTLRVDLPATYAVTGATDHEVVLTFRAQVTNRTATNAGTRFDNYGTLAWEEADGAPSHSATSPRSRVTAVEPDIDVTKSSEDADGVASPGETITFDVRVRNTGSNLSTAYETTVVDVLPTSMTPVVNASNEVLGGTGHGANAYVGQWASGTRTITWTIPSLAPSAAIDLYYDVVVADEVLALGSYRNDVTATTSSMAGTPTGERSDTSTPTTARYTDTASATLTGPPLSLSKVVDLAGATLGDVVEYTLTVTVPGGVTTYDASILDTLPTGMEYVAGSTTSSCAASCGLGVVEPVTSGQRLGWFLGDIASDSATRVVTVTYDARVLGSEAIIAGDVLRNEASLRYSGTDTLSGLSTPSDADGLGSGTPIVRASTTVLEPRIVLTKTVASGADQVAARRVVPGETVTYTITLENRGSSTAFDVAVADTTDPRFTDVTLVPAPTSTAGVVLTDADPSVDGSLAFTVPSIAAGSTATIVYTATVPDPLAANPAGPELSNSAVSTYSSKGGVVDEERPYTSNTDTVGLEGDVASLGDTVWFDTNGNGVQESGELGVQGVTVTVTYLGADGVLDTAPGGDDEVHVATTGTDGTYLVEDLPQGDYLVVLSGVPAGTVTTYDEDSGTTTPDGRTAVTLADGDAYVTADFGIRGSGTVGDTVWLDHDGDGVQDVGEPGVGGVDVTVTWPATAGQPAGSVTTTTAADGTWSVTGIPAVDVTVTLDPDTYPAGTALVSEVKGGLVDGTSTDALAAGETDNDHDFGLRGTGAIGDRVWVDTDADGVQDEGEPGIPGATVVVRWLGGDGLPGTADDLAVTTTTGADGAYLVDGLPAGEYVVTVTALPTALAPTYDEDDGTASPNSATEVTLPAGGSYLTADFGYVAATGVGDTIWLDTNGDGLQDVGEPGIAGVEVTVTAAGTDGVVGTADDIVRTTTTAENGSWLVTGLPAGPAQVEVTGGLPEGITPTYDADGTDTPGVSLVTLVQDVTDLDQDFGYVGANSIGDTVWVDVDADGVQDAGEPGLPGVTVAVLWFGQDGVEGGDDDILFLTVTAEDGTYLVDGLPNGDYTVSIVDGVPDGYTESYDETGALDGVSVVGALGADGPEDHRSADFGYAGTGAIGGTVWLDREVDGVLDTPTEAGIPGIVIDVVWAGPDGLLGTEDDVELSAVTGEGGTWSIENMPPGPFTATVDRTTIPEGTSVVWDRANGTSSPDGVYVGDLGAGEVRTDIDTAVKGTGSIGDLVWIDSDKDGVRDPNEPAATNVRVVVTWLGEDGVLGGGDDVTIEVRTDANGIYVADGLPAGAYLVTFDATTFPKGTAAFADLDGGDPLVTSVSLTTGQVRTDVDLVLRPTALASTGATVGGILALVLLLLGSGLVLRRRASVLAARVE